MESSIIRRDGRTRTDDGIKGASLSVVGNSLSGGKSSLAGSRQGKGGRDVERTGWPRFDFCTSERKHFIALDCSECYVGNSYPRFSGEVLLIISHIWEIYRIIICTVYTSNKCPRPAADETLSASAELTDAAAGASVVPKSVSQSHVFPRECFLFFGETI